MKPFRDRMDQEGRRVAYTPAEFAALFGREKSWTYRQIYSGKLKTIKGMGGQLIPAAEADRIVEGAQFIDPAPEYLGSASVRRGPGHWKQLKRGNQHNKS